MMMIASWLLYRPICLNVLYNGYSNASCGIMLASMIASTIHVLPLTRPMPRAKELSTESTTAATATTNEGTA